MGAENVGFEKQELTTFKKIGEKMTIKKTEKYPPNPYNRALTTAEAAQELEVSEWRLRSWRMIEDHGLSFFKRDGTKGHCFYRWEDVIDYKSKIESGEVTP